MRNAVAVRPRAAALLLAVIGLVVTSCSGGGNGDETARLHRLFKGADCATLRVTLDESSLAARLAGPADPTPALETTAKFLRTARSRAPEALARDVRVLATTYAKLAIGAKAVDWAAIGRGDPAATLPATRLAERLAEPRFGSAAFVLARAADRGCPT